jgi:hypothetical protein
MSRLPPALARRLDGLARRAHRFHRFAHHPLCGAYAGEVLRVGRRTRLCRGGTLVAVGAVAGAAAGLVAPPLPVAAWLAGPPLLAGWARLALDARDGRFRPKWLTRAAPMALATGLAVAGLGAGLGPDPAGWAGLAAAGATGLVVALGLARYRRRGPDRTACVGCPQAPPGPRCDGFRAVARRERAFSRLASRWIDRDRAGSCETAPP